MHTHLQIITSRLSILSILNIQSNQPLSENSLNNIGEDLKLRHGKYLHVFNLTTIRIERLGDPSLQSTNFKWRGIPCSLTQTIKILAAMDTYLRCKMANSIVFIVGDADSAKFCQFVIQSYYQLLSLSLKIEQVPKKFANLTNYENLMNQFLGLYANCEVKNPPIKIIQSIEFVASDREPFIPIFQIFNEFRHNSFEPIYQHRIQPQLIDYYLQLKSPLKTGIGLKFCDKKPETKYLSYPCLVAGDVKIMFYSFENIVKEPEFMVGFNTKALQYEQSAVILKPQDWYFYNKKQNRDYSKILLKIQLADYCKQCSNQSQCEDCLEKIKKISQRYLQTQVELQKLKRKRTQSQIKSLLSL